MSRMKLHKSVRLGAYEIYPIYELNYDDLKVLPGYTLIESNDNVSPNANKFRHWSLINNDIPSHTDYFPRRPTEDGNILPCDTRYNNLIDGRYYMPETTTESFTEVEQSDVQPEDWGVNPNYITFNNITQSFNDRPGGDFGDVNVCIPTPVNIYETWNSSTTYYEDTKRFLVRKFFLEDGKSFSVSKAGYYNYNRWLGISFGNGTLTSYNSGTSGQESRYVGYYFTRSDGSVIDRHYKAEYAYGITGIESGADYNWPLWQNGKNITQFFVHYNSGTTDFYGIAIAQMDNFLETASPIALDVVVFDALWWDKSIIEGGGGSGQWTTDGPTSYVQGGQGKFQAPSNNRGDRTGSDVADIKDNWNGKQNNITSVGYNRYVLGENDAAAFGQFAQQLWNPDFWDGFANKFFNPISSILVSHMMPVNLAPPIRTGAATRDHIYAAQTVLTPDYTVTKFLSYYTNYHVGDIDISTYTDSFADFENTAIYIHLPYIGIKQLDISSCMGGWLAVDYISDAFSGDVIAFVTVSDRIGNRQRRYSWKGNCAKEVPLAQRTNVWSNIVSSAAPLAIGALTAGVGGAVLGAVGEYVSAGVGGGVGVGAMLKSLPGVASEFLPQAALSGLKSGAVGAAVGIGRSTNAALQSGVATTTSNAEGGSVSTPIDTQCWVLITRPQWSAPDDYGVQLGYPSDIGGTINQSDTEAGDPFTNFLSVRSIKLDGIDCTDEERAEIHNLMAAGVFVS